MIEIQRILCPVDFSDYSRLALDHAVAIARWYTSTITVLHVVATTVPGFEPVPLSDADRGRVLADLQRLIADESAPGVPMEAMIREGRPEPEILSQAASMGADLLILGTHGRSGFERLMLGSVTERLLRKADCPVLTIPRRLPEAVPATPILFKEILCPVDFSDSSLHALAYAMSLAQEADARLTVLHVISHAFEEAYGGPALLGATDMGLTLSDFRRQREEEVRRRLDDLVPATVAASCTVETILTHGKPWREIVRVAGERRSDLIVMGVQGRGPADLVLFGSTTQHVVRQAVCPVLTLRKP